MSTHKRPTRGDDGFVMVWFAIVMILLLAMGAFTIDILHGYSAAQEAQNAADAGSLAGVVVMPDFSQADPLAQQVSGNNIDGATITPQPTAQSNQLRVVVEKDIDTFFARVFGVDTMKVRRSAIAEYDAPKPLDLVLIIDRTGSMTTTDLNNAKDASRDVMSFLDPSREHLALGVLGPSSTTAGSPCPAATYGRLAAESAWYGPSATWIVAPYPAPAGTAGFVSDYQNPTSQIQRTISCLENNGFTDLGTPIDRAQAYFAAHGRPGAKRGIIFMTDGAANRPGTNPNPCGYAVTQANEAHAAGIDILTIGFGVQGALCEVDSAAPYRGADVTEVLADMASPINGTPADNDGCTDAENQDGDNFFCQPKTEDLSSVFVAAASQLAGRESRLVK